MEAEITSDSADAQPAQTEGAEANNFAIAATPGNWFNIACVPSHLARHGLDTDLRRRGLSQFSKNVHLQKQSDTAAAYRCYFRINPAHIGCFNPQLVTQEYLEENGYDTTIKLTGGAPGQICYFKKAFMYHYLNLIAILKQKGALSDLNQCLVPSAAHAVQKLATPLTSE